MGHTDGRKIPPTLTPGKALLPQTRLHVAGPGRDPSWGPQPSAWPAHRGGRSGWKHLREAKGMDFTLSPSSLALDGPPHDLSTLGRDSTAAEDPREVRSRGHHSTPQPGLSLPRMALQAVPGCSRPGIPFPAGGRPGVQRLYYRFLALLTPCPLPCYCPLFPGRCPLHLFCLCSGEKALLLPSASDSKVARHGTVPEPDFI